MFATKYSKELCPSIEDACSEFVWDCLSDYIPSYLSECIDYHKFITNNFEKEIEIEETNESYIFLSETDFDELSID